MTRSSSICGDGEVFGPYLVFERIGVGGMATVHRAKERGIEGFERRVALKRLLPHLAEDEKFVRSFVREAKLASLLQHPNIVQLYELGRVGHVYFISMELIEGRDLRQVLRQSRKATGPPPIPLVVEILTQLCDALEYAHTRADEHGQPLGLVHRDVSPSNVIVAESGHIKVIDFGIAKATSIHLRTQSGRVKGKMAYMSPEAIKGMELDGRSDLFSAGVLAHELLTARPLFATKNDYQTLMRVQKATVAPPSTYNQDCPPELDAIVLKALSRDRDHRWQSAAEMRDALNQLRRAYQLSTSHTDIAKWMEWAFAVDDQVSANLKPTTTTPVRVPGQATMSSQARRYLHTPVTGPMQIPIGGVALPVAEEDDEVIEIAWGGRSNHDAIPVLLDEVPDVSDKIALPEVVEVGGGGTSATTLVGQAPPPPVVRARSSAELPAWARGSRRLLEEEEDDDEELEFDRVPIPRARTRARTTSSGPITVTPATPTVTATYDEVPIDDDEGPSVRLPVVRFREPGTGEPIPRPAPLIGSSIVDRNQPRRLGHLAVTAAGVVALALAAVLLLRNHGDGATARATPPADAVALNIAVEPADAEIAIEGHGVHQGSPLRVDLEPGSYQVEIRRDGYKSWVSTVELHDRENQAVRVALERGGSSGASVAIGAVPPGTEVLIDETPIEGTTPAVVDVEPGPHHIAIADRAGVLWAHQFEAAANTRYEFHPVLDPRQVRHSSHHDQALDGPLVEGPTVSHAGAANHAPATSQRSDTGVAIPTTAITPLPIDSEPPPPAVVAARGPVVVPPSAVTKLSGTVPVIRQRRGEAAPERVSAKLCIDQGGAVTQVDILTPVPDRVASTLRDSLHQWRYRPYRSGSDPVSACFAVSFKATVE